MKKLALAFGAACLSLVAATSEAAVIFSFEENGGDVVGTLSGSLDLTGAQSTFPGSVSGSIGQILPQAGSVTLLPAPTTLDSYLTSMNSFGAGIATVATSLAGSAFEIDGFNGIVRLPDGYAGESLSGTLTFAGSNFASLGIIPGAYVYSLPNDTITLRFGPGTGTVIPLPATLPLLLGALGLAAAVMRRRPDRRS